MLPFFADGRNGRGRNHGALADCDARRLGADLIRITTGKTNDKSKAQNGGARLLEKAGGPNKELPPALRLRPASWGSDRHQRCDDGQEQSVQGRHLSGGPEVSALD